MLSKCAIHNNTSYAVVVLHIQINTMLCRSDDSIDLVKINLNDRVNPNVNKGYNRYIFLAGGISGIFEVTVSHSLDVVKTDMQYKIASGLKINSPLIHMLDKYRSGGILSLYKGYLPRIIGIVPMRSVFWGTQNMTHGYLEQFFDISDGNRALCAGIVGGASQTLIDNPIEIVKTRIITAKKTRNFRSFCIPNNISLYYKGFYPTLFRNVGFMVVLNRTTTAFDSDSYIVKFLAAGVGGFMASVITQPLDYVKTQIHASDHDQKISPSKIFIDAWKRDPYILMTGYMPRALLGSVNMGVGFCAFSFILAHFRSDDQ